MSLSEFSTRYPVTVGMATLAIILLGWISFNRLGTDLLPDLQTPVITIDLRAPGKSPREIEERYTRRLERDVSTVRRVKRVYSVTRSGQVVVVAEFSWDADMDFALLDVQKKVGQYAADNEVSLLDVSREDPQALPVMRLAITAEEDQHDLDGLLGSLETLVKPKLESLDGVASAEIEGGAEKEIQVTLDPYLLEAFGITPAAIVDRIKAAEADISGGTLKDGQQSYLVKALGRLTDMADVGELIAGERQEGSEAGSTRVPIRVKDVGQVGLAYREQETQVRLNGRECVGIAIYKEAGSNTVTVVESVQKLIEQLSKDLPGITFTTVENQARFVQSAVGEVTDSALWGALLAIGVLLVALRSFTATFVIGLAIPISILATFTLMYFQNLTLNIMTLGGLALGAGMLVDNAIVVIENIYRHIEKGQDVKVASAIGASEVGVAILASTLTTVSVFLPIVYLQGLAGELFKDQAWTVAFSLLSSLFVAMTTVPMLASRIFQHGVKMDMANTKNWYLNILTYVLNHKTSTILTTLLCLGISVYLLQDIDSEFIPHEDQGLFEVQIALPEGTRLDVTDRIGQRVAEIIRQIGGSDIAHVYVRAGIDPARIASGNDPTGPNRCSALVLLTAQKKGSISDLVEALDPHLQALPEVEVKYHLHNSSLEGVMGSQDAPVQIEVTGENLDVLQNLTRQLQTQIESLPGIYNVRTSFQGGQPEVDLSVYEEVASAFGLTTQSISRTVERQLSGEIAGELSKDQRTRDIRVKYEDVDLRELGMLRIEGNSGALLILQDVANLNIVEGPREILRENQRRVGRLTGYLASGISLSEGVVQIQSALGQVVVPSGYHITIGGEERERAESFESLTFALVLSLVLVYMVMASLFESLLHPLTVMLSLPLAGIGVVLAFWALDQPLSVMAYIGIIMLGGIAVNSAIILVDRINQLQSTGMVLRQAILHGSKDRLRPIMMTTATTVLALVPMAAGFGEGAKLRAPMAIAVIGGLVSSTMMTLVVIPLMYEAVEKFRRKKQP